MPISIIKHVSRTISGGSMDVMFLLRSIRAIRKMVSHLRLGNIMRHENTLLFHIVLDYGSCLKNISFYYP